MRFSVVVQFEPPRHTECAYYVAGTLHVPSPRQIASKCTTMRFSSHPIAQNLFKLAISVTISDGRWKPVERGSSMDCVNLGRTGLKVSRLCLGCMTYGSSAWRPWVLNEHESRPFIMRALELGINFFDTANMYSDGASEEVLGRAIRDLVPRDEVVIATKVYNPMGPDRTRAACRGNISSTKSTPASAGSAPIMSICTKRTGGIMRRRSRRRSKRSTTWSVRARHAISAHRRCTPGNSPKRCSRPICTASRDLSRCRIN